MDVAPSMVQRSGDKLIVRRVVSGEQVHLSDQNPPAVQSDDGESTDQQLLLDRWRRFSTDASANYDEPLTDGEGTQPGPSSQGATDHDQQQQQQQQLPQCKIKRNYSCGRCTYFTQNPRKYLTHLRDTHGEKIVINECKRCLYASRHYQKLVRHMKMVHGSVDGIRKSAFGASRRRVQKSYGGQMHLGQVMPAAVPKLSDSEALTTAYVQQLVASGLPKLLEEMEKSGAALAANFAREASTIKVELDQLKQSMPYTSDETVQEVSEGDRIDSKPSEEPKKRSRPVPNLIPLNMSTSTSGSSATPKTTPQKFVKPIPIAALKAENGESDRTSEDYPLSLTKHQQPVATHPDDIMTKCMYCELSFKPVEALANHIKLAHKNDLIAFLLANSFDNVTDAADKPVPQHPAEPTERTTVNEIWKRLLERSAESSVQTPRKYEAGGSSGSAKDLSNDTDTDDDNREESHQSQTFCGVETAPGYGEVTNRLPTIDPTTVGRTGSGGSSGGSGLMKKVFKCPHCSFWASTASRFHVHIVGHLNKKPFECSLCAYRSNWRWDITKHIRLKTIRDPSHKNAGVLMNDETGRRNYTKYNKYIALMQITDK